jgi:nitroreductase
MDFAEVVRKRRMVRHFSPEPVAPEVIDRLVGYAQRAPSAGFSQGVQFVAVTEPETRRRIAEIAGEREGYVASGFDPFVSEAPLQIIVCTSEKVYKDRYREPDKMPDPTQPQPEWPVPYWHTDAGMSLLLILLGAVNEGLQAGFVGVWDQEGLRELLGIPDHFTPIGVTLVGHGLPDRPSPSLKRGRRPLEEVLHREQW